MTPDPTMMRRFASESAGVLAPDVRTWALIVLASGLKGPERTAARDERLREAGAIVGGTRWARVKAILAVLERTGASDPAVSALVAEALAFTPGRKLGQRQLLRVFAGH